MISLAGRGMDHLLHRVLRFDRFTLDLARGCLRAGDQEIDLRPKTFEVLCYLAEHAGRLVPKQELFDAAWPNVSVCDDSLVQCIRELRQKLGDDDHRLIKTVSRRGYLLDVTILPQTPLPMSDGPAVIPDGPVVIPVEGRQKPAARPDVLHGGVIRAQRLRTWGAAAASVICAAMMVMYLHGWPVSPSVSGQVRLAENAPAEPQLHPTFKDCAECPEMVALSAGEFMMGSPGDERRRQGVEGLPRRVVIPKQIAVGKFEVTVDQFAVFVTETGMTVGDLCHVMVDFSGARPVWGAPEASFRQPGFEVTGSQPVVCVSWHEAQAYAAWLKRRTGKPYRLPTEAEWEYAARADTSTAYSFGDDETALCAYARFADLGSRLGWGRTCRSDTTAFGPLPVGSFKPNRWGIFDMLGNAWEWVEDCWTPIPTEIPTDGSAFSRPGSCEEGVMRGGSWAAAPSRLRSATRWPMRATSQYHHLGFRVALSLGE
jgi:formylglycine-generating enzyme required for sulfatase activity/DNA-binding winged helix-turn-helix (wHTH) protein